MSRRRKGNANRRKEVTPAAASPRVSRVQVGLALVLLLTFLVYLPASTGTRLWDDDAHITSPALQSLHGLYRIWFEPGATQQYYPILHTAFWLEHKLWGDSVVGYHAVTVLWHSLAVILVYLNLKKLEVPGALLASAIFAVHPVMVESVAWITEQKNTLSIVFYLATMLAYLNFDESRRRADYLLALGLFVLALLAKTATVTLPPAVLIILWWKRGSLSWRRDVLPLLPFFASAAVAGVVTSWVERNLLGAEGANYTLNYVGRFLLAGQAIWFYLSKLVWPINLIPVYPRWQVDSAIWWQWIYPFAALALTVGLWFARKWSRAPLAGWLFFCATLFPLLGFFKVSFFLCSFVADRFQYIASLGIIAPAAAGITILLARLPQSIRVVGYTACVFLVAALGVLTARQARIYTDAITFYQATIDRNPNDWMAHYNLGPVLFSSGEHQKAIEHSHEALRIKPDFAPAEFNLATFLAATGQTTEAEAHFRKALSLHPIYPRAQLAFGSLLLRTGRPEEAIREFQAALNVKPDDPVALNNMAVALFTVKRFPDAIERLEHALKVDPYNAESHVLMGVALTQLGKVSLAIEQYRAVLELDPNNLKARHNLGTLLAKSGLISEAISQFQQEIRMDPKSVMAYSSIAQALALAGRSNEAVAAAEKAIELARANGQSSEAKQLEEQLKNYQAQLRRDANTSSKLPSSIPENARDAIS